MHTNVVPDVYKNDIHRWEQQDYTGAFVRFRPFLTLLKDKWLN